jgi:hypothetical protein
MWKWITTLIFIVVIILSFSGHDQALVVMGGLCTLATAILLVFEKLFQPLVQYLSKRLHKRRLEKLDWKIIDNSVNTPRRQRDCERRESLGICTGLECYEYQECHFNIKKALPD